ncbi:tyrosine-type recombinase/integrase [Vermiculatibacterium agrestimuris]|uniref:tyrosine-type recombinase/integrase n=1 Tax=Vermiculatibacterium agrestimuris TaxID=2941519 RepID=UPI00203AAD9D|nr:site-specific integrase [Vermiculatibacterium agrestimuris]
MSRRAYERGISYDSARQIYYLYMDLGRDQDGHRQRQYRTFNSLTEARKARDAHLADRARATRIPDLTLTLDDWLEEWMTDIIIPNRAETTVYGYQKIIENHISPCLGDIPLQTLSPKDLQHYYAEMMREKGLCANSVRRHHDLLAAALHAALRQDLILRSPTDRVEPPRVIPKETRFYTSESLKKLYQLLEGHWLETAVHLAGSLGLRREEICGLRWDSVDFQLRKIHIRAARTAAGAKIIDKETKNRSSARVLHMGDDIFSLLKRERLRQNERKLALGKDWPESGLVAVDNNGKPFSPNCLTMNFTRFIRTHPELPPLTFHGLRHTFATVASAQGAPLFDIGKALGHSTPATTGKIYTHLVDQLHAETLERVAQALR